MKTIILAFVLIAIVNIFAGLMAKYTGDAFNDQLLKGAVALVCVLIAKEIINSTK